MTMPIILVVDDVEKTRYAIERLLQSDGYVVETARSEEDAVQRATRKTPQLILVNLGSPPHEAVATAQRIRRQGLPHSNVPIVLFGIESAAAGKNVDFGGNVYVAHPDNFDQLRYFLRLLLVASPQTAKGASFRHPVNGQTRS